LALGLACPALAATDVHIRLSGQSQAPLQLALGLPPFVAGTPTRPEEALLARELREVARADLLFSRYFRLLEEGPHFHGGNLREILPEWKARGGGWLLAAKASQEGSRISLAASLLNLSSSEAVFERTYRQEAAHARQLAHRLSDDIVLALTGRRGVAQTRIAFANDQSGRKEICLMDYDGADLRVLTRDRSISLLPRFSPDRRLLAFTGYRDGNPDLFLLDLEKGTRRLLSGMQGLNVAGGFSPDGTQILMTLSRGGSPNLYAKSLSDGSLTRLTQHFGADSSPTFSPDGSQVAFVSDRSGNPQIHLLDLDTLRARRLTDLNWCDSPSWSPTGEWIAAACRMHPKDKMDIFLVDVTGNVIRQLTRGEGSNENPSWSPDGRFLVFASTRGGRPELYLMDADGSAPHRLAELPGGSYTPSWSW